MRRLKLRSGQTSFLWSRTAASECRTAAKPHRRKQRAHTFTHSQVLVVLSQAFWGPVQADSGTASMFSKLSAYARSPIIQNMW